MGKILLAPLAFIYGLAISIRNKLFDWGLLPSREYDIPIISVGNITVGGTGKTPVCEMLIDRLKDSHKIAFLSRGYKRRTKGYIEAAVNSSFLDIGDEPKQVKRKFPDIVVAVCEKRNEGIQRILADHPETELIIMDDAFQHRYVEPWINIVLMDYNRPIYKDHLLPVGQLRDRPSQLHRAHYILVTKCPADLNALDKRLVSKHLGLYPYQKLYFSSMINGALLPLFGQDTKVITEGQDIIVMAGIANPDPLIEGLSGKYNVVGTLLYGDHHPYRRRDLKDMENALESTEPGTVIVTTEKDAVKLINSKKIPEQLRSKLFYIPVSAVINEDKEKEFINKIKEDVKTNPKHSFLHIGQN